MARERDPALDLSGLEDAFEWLSARKNMLVGLALVIVLAIAATSFIQRQARESAVQPWRSIFTASESPWHATSGSLNDAGQRAGASDAAAYAAYWRPLRMYEEGDRSAALSGLNEFKSKFPNHPLCTSTVHPPDQTAITSTVSALEQLQKWNEQHPLPTANPPPSGATSVTFVTERGSIVLALYPEVAPASCAAFLQIAASLKDQFIAKTAPDRWVELGLTEAGAPIETQAFTENFPPYESTSLMHVRGAASFRQTPFSKGPFNIDVHVQLETDFEMDGQSSVFGQVTEGLDLLVAISKDERRTDLPQVLAKPVKITDVVVRRPDGQ